MTCQDSSSNEFFGYLGFYNNAKEFGCLYLRIAGETFMHCVNPSNKTHDDRWWFFVPSQFSLDGMRKKLIMIVDAIEEADDQEQIAQWQQGGFQYL